MEIAVTPARERIGLGYESHVCFHSNFFTKEKGKEGRVFSLFPCFKDKALFNLSNIVNGIVGRHSDRDTSNSRGFCLNISVFWVPLFFSDAPFCSSSH